MMGRALLRLADQAHVLYCEQSSQPGGSPDERVSAFHAAITGRFYA